MSSGYADVNGTRFWYEVAGSGPALVMAHGHLIDSGQWDGQMAAFAAEYRAIRYDARGFGRSDAQAGPFSLSEDLRGLLGFLGVERAFLVGCSGGGMTVLDLALAHPELVAALVLVGSGLPGYQLTGDPPARLAEHRKALADGDVDRAVELALQVWMDGERRRPDEVDAGARERTREMMAREIPRKRDAADLRWEEPPAATRLGEVRAPTLVILGADDWSPIHVIAELLAAGIPGARKVVIADAGHHPNMEHPEEFNELVLSFLREVRAG